MSKTQKLVDPRGAIPAAEAAVVAALASGKGSTEACAAAGYNLTPQNAKTLAKELWRRHVTANGSVMEAFADVGIDPAFVAKKFKSLLDAQESVVTKHGIVEVPDNGAQLKALDMVMKTTGAYAPKATVTAELKFEKILLEIDGLDDE